MNTNGFAGTSLLRRAILCACLSGVVAGFSGCGGGGSSDGGDPHYSIAVIEDVATSKSSTIRYDFFPSSINDDGNVTGKAVFTESTAIFPLSSSKAAAPHTLIVETPFVYFQGTTTILDSINGGATKITRKNHIFVPGHPYYDINGNPSIQWTHKIGGQYVYPVDMNDSDHYAAILTDYSTGDYDTTKDRLIFDNGSAATDLGAPRPGDAVNANILINNSDKVIGAVTGTAGDVKIAVYPAPKTTPTLIDNGFVVQAVNDRGAIIGNTNAASDANQALILANGSREEIPPIAGDTSARVFGFNNQGECVGASYNSHVTTGYLTAFLYRKRRTVNLNSLIPANSGWVLTSAASINNRGQICGFGLYQGVSKGFVLTPQ